MFKKEITYTDYNGTERTETFYFNLSKAELAEMQLSASGGFESYIQSIIEAKDAASMVKIFKDVILMSYGEKSPDGKRFIKNAEVRDSFAQTEAYSVLFMELVSDDKAASAFINGIMPSDLQEQLGAEIVK